MKTSWIIGIFTMFILLSLISGILEAQYLGGQEDQVDTFTKLMSPPSFTSMNPLNVLWTVVTIGWHYLTAFWDMLWFNYAFFTGGWTIIKWIVFFPISIGVVFSFISLIRGTSSS